MDTHNMKLKNNAKNSFKMEMGKPLKEKPSKLKNLFIHLTNNKKKKTFTLKTSPLPPSKLWSLF